NPLIDYPSIRVLRQILVDEQERSTLGNEMLRVLRLAKPDENRTTDWRGHYAAFLAYAGGILGHEPKPAAAPKPRVDAEYHIKGEFLRDERFKTTLPKVAPAEFEGDKLRLMMWARSQEMTAAELMASVIFEWDDLPTEAVVDLARHCWDEVRHSLFGQAALQAEGKPLSSLPSWVGYAKHTLPAPPPKRYAHLRPGTE